MTTREETPRVLVFAGAERAEEARAVLAAAAPGRLRADVAGAADEVYFAVAGGRADGVVFDWDPSRAGQESRVAAFRREFPRLALVAWLPEGDPGARAAALAVGVDECHAGPASPALALAVADALVRARARPPRGWAARREGPSETGDQGWYRAFFEHAPFGAVVVDAQGRFSLANPAFQAMLGRGTEELRSLSVADVSHPDDMGRDTELFLEILAGVRDHYEIEKRYLRADGSELWGRFGLFVERGPDGTPERGFGVVEDVTGQRRLRRELEQSQKLEALGRLTGGIAHDYNNIAMIVAGTVRLMMARREWDGETLDELRAIAHAVARAARLSQQLLAFGRRQVLRPAPLDLNEVLSEMEPLLSRLLVTGISLEWGLAAGGVPAVADRAQVEQVVMNLVINARDASTPGGVIRVETALEEGRPGEPPRVLLAVSDEGCGMDEATLARVFEPFFTTKAERGTGMGLATVHGIVQQSGGSIGVDSAPGRGTRFRVYLPRADGVPGVVPVAAAAPPAPLPPRDGEAATVLVVEDERMIRRVVCRFLSHAGFRVLQASCGDEALAVCGATPGPLDVLVTDVVMPGASGREVAGRLRARHPDLRVIYMSGYAEDEALRSGSVETGALFLQKPVEPEQLVAAVHEALGIPSAAVPAPAPAAA